MHIPDNYLSPQTCAVMTAAMVPVWGVCIKKVRADLSSREVPMMGVGAAFSFLGMMFNVPLPGGTTGHAVGGTLIAMLLGPYAACICVSVALLLQALLFGDGGILSFGANCFNMAFVLPFVGWLTARALQKLVKAKTVRGRALCAAGGSYVGINAAALCAAIEFGIQPMLFRDASGQALYCPYDLSVSIPAMMAGHLTVFGLAEAVFTGLIYAFVVKTSPEMERKDAGTAKTSLPVRILLGVLILAVPLGLLAQGTAWGEWGSDEIASTGAGYTPAGMANGFDFSALLPDYSVAGLPDAVGYILSAAIGAAVLLIVFKLLPLGRRRESTS
ncbi:MAG: cobalt transporter CbiM [Lachnospiraceae bacterium]